MRCGNMLICLHQDTPMPSWISTSTLLLITLVPVWPVSVRLGVLFSSR